MSTFGDALLVLAGLVLIVFVVDAAIRTFVVPRGTVVFLTVVVFMGVRALLAPFTRASVGYERRDRVMAIYAPFALLALPTVSLVLIFFAYSFIFAGLVHEGYREAIVLSGSSLMTLGFERPSDLPSTLFAFSEAAIGLGLLALLIAYLPTIYNSFSRREVAVTDLSIRAGTPPTPVEWLVRAHRTGFLLDMDGFWEQWMTWFTEVAETHTSYAALVFFRSPHPHRNWVTAAGAVLDTAAVRLAVCDIPWSAAAPLCIRSGYVALREIAGFFGIDYDEEPAPDDPISIAREEFDEVYDDLTAAGLPVKADREQAWRDFAGWRVNYDQVLHALAALVMAPYAPWTSDRSPTNAPPHYRLGRRRKAVAQRRVTAPQGAATLKTRPPQ